MITQGSRLKKGADYQVIFQGLGAMQAHCIQMPYQFIQGSLAVVHAGFLHERLYALQSHTDERRSKKSHS